MAVISKGQLWTGGIPYTICSGTYKTWVMARIYEFNERVGKQVFYPKSMNKDVDYVQFSLSSSHASCKIGRRGGMQMLSFKKTCESIWHEMGHACGLCHEHYHDKSPYMSNIFPKVFIASTGKLSDIKKIVDNNLNIDEQVAMANYSSRQSIGDYDSKSIMLYAKYAGPSAIQNKTLSDGDCAAIRSLFP